MVHFVGLLCVVVAADSAIAQTSRSHYVGRNAAYEEPATLMPPGEHEWFVGPVLPTSFGDDAGFSSLIPAVVPEPAFENPMSAFSGAFVPSTEPTAAPQFSDDSGRRFPQLGAFAGKIWDDHRHYYSIASLKRNAIVFGVAAVMANTSVDEDLDVAWQREIGRNQDIQWFKQFGEGEYVIAGSAGALVAGWMLRDYAGGEIVAEFGSRSSRALIVGLPTLALMQFVLGASRPVDYANGSRWVPFYDSNGVSGHAFMGALPLLTVAQMTDRPVLKIGCYAAAAMPGLSRLNDRSHYASQVMLGWWMAATAVMAVNETETGRPWSIVPWSAQGGGGMGYQLHF